MRLGQTNVRLLDAHLQPQLELIRGFWPNLTPNLITAFRVLIFLPLYSFSALIFPAALPIFCLADGWTDVADGALARIKELGSPMGMFWDQASDKASNHGRVGLLWYMGVIPTGIWGNGQIICALVITLLCDLINFSLRLYQIKHKQFGKKGGPALIGKIKVWCQGYAITLFSIVYARECALDLMSEFSFYFSMLLVALLAGCIMPSRKSVKFFKDWVWLGLVLGNIILMAAAMTPELTIATEALAEGALLLALPCALASTSFQIVFHLREEVKA